MKLDRITISGYKNISETGITFGGFNALIALNNYGKSNLIEAIDFSNDFIKASNKNKSQMMQSRTRIPINNLIAGKDFAFDLIYETVFEKIHYEVNYSFSFEWLNAENKGKRIKSEILKLKKKEKDAKYFTYINRDEDKRVYLNSKTGRCDKDILIEENALIINKLLNFDDLFYLDIVREINSFNFSIFSLRDIEKRFTTGFVVDENNIDDELKLSEVPSIAKYFYYLQNEDKSKYEILVNSIQDLLPDVEYIKPIEIDFKKESTKNRKNKFIPFELPEKIYDIRVKIKTNNQETSVQNLSDGSKRIFYVLANVLMAEMHPCHLLVFEELENSIHPALLQRLLMIISSLTHKTRILITSHSPYLIKYIDLNDIYIGIPNKDGVATFCKVKKSKQAKLIKYATDAETNIGDFVFDMLIEGFNENSFWNDFI